MNIFRVIRQTPRFRMVYLLFGLLGLMAAAESSGATPSETTVEGFFTAVRVVM